MLTYLYLLSQALRGYNSREVKNFSSPNQNYIAAIITHATMYVGWPKGWAVFRLAKEVWNEATEAVSEKDMGLSRMKDTES